MILVDQNRYLEELKEIELEKGRNNHRQDLLNLQEKKHLQELIGQLNWLSTQTRPDISFDVCDLSSKINIAVVDDVMYVNKIIRKLKLQSVSLVFSKLHDLGSLSIDCYSDASFDNLLNGASQDGYIVYISDQYNNKNVVSWQSKKLRRVVKSTLAAETLALLDAAEAGVFLSKMICQAINVSCPVVGYFVDNRSLVEAVHSTKNVEDKMLRINMSVLRDMLDQGDISSVEWVQSTKQLANPLTKKGANAADLLQSLC